MKKTSKVSKPVHKKPTIEQPTNPITPPTRWSKDWSQVSKNDSTESTPMKLGDKPSRARRIGANVPESKVSKPSKKGTHTKK